MFSCPSVGQIKLPNKVLLACEIDFLVVFYLVCLFEFLMCETGMKAKLGLFLPQRTKMDSVARFLLWIVRVA